MTTHFWLSALLGLLFFQGTVVAAEPAASEKLLQVNLEAVEETLREKSTNDAGSKPLCIVTINPEGRVKVARGAAELSLAEEKPTLALVQVFNQSGGQQTLDVHSSYFGASKNPFKVGLVESEAKPLKLSAALSGAEMEYRLMFVQCAASGKREITLHWNAGQGTQDIGFRGEVSILLDVKK